MTSFQDAKYSNSTYNFFTVTKAVTYSSLHRFNRLRGTPTTKSSEINSYLRKLLQFSPREKTKQCFQWDISCLRMILQISDARNHFAFFNICANFFSDKSLQSLPYFSFRKKRVCLQQPLLTSSCCYLGCQHYTLVSQLLGHTHTPSVTISKKQNIEKPTETVMSHYSNLSAKPQLSRNTPFGCMLPSHCCIVSAWDFCSNKPTWGFIGPRRFELQNKSYTCNQDYTKDACTTKVMTLQLQKPQRFQNI